MTETILTGGCQCGRVRYATSVVPDDVSVCHCRMCQKAVGGPFIALALVHPDQITWTRGKPASFRSSTHRNPPVLRRLRHAARLRGR